MTQLADRVAIVTGASRGIGFAIAQRFVAVAVIAVVTRLDSRLQGGVAWRLTVGTA